MKWETSTQHFLLCRSEDWGFEQMRAAHSGAEAVKLLCPRQSGSFRTQTMYLCGNAETFSTAWLHHYRGLKRSPSPPTVRGARKPQGPFALSSPCCCRAQAAPRNELIWSQTTGRP